MTVRVVSAPPSSSSRQSEIDLVDAERLAVDLGRGPHRHDVVHRAALLLLVELGGGLGELDRRDDAVLVEVARPAAEHDRALRPALRSGQRSSAKPSSLPIIIAGSGAARSSIDLGGAALGLDGVEQAVDLRRGCRPPSR